MPDLVFDCEPSTFERCEATRAMPHLDVHAAYREVLRAKWAESTPKWTNRQPPEWR